MSGAHEIVQHPIAKARPMTGGGRVLAICWGNFVLRLDDAEARRARHAIASAPEAVCEALSLFFPPMQTAADLEAFDAILAQFLILEFDRDGIWTWVDVRGQGPARGQGSRGEGA